eukprot:scaffold10887_cov109-Isochrysis_galbana.AAC.1
MSRGHSAGRVGFCEGTHSGYVRITSARGSAQRGHWLWMVGGGAAWVVGRGRSGQVEGDELGRDGGARVAPAVGVILLGVQMVGDVEECVQRLSYHQRQQPVFDRSRPAARDQSEAGGDRGVESELGAAGGGERVPDSRRLWPRDGIEARVANDVAAGTREENGEAGRVNAQAELAPTDAKDLGVLEGVARHRVGRLSRHNLRIPRRIVGVGVVVLVQHPLPPWVGQPGERDQPCDERVEPAGGEGGVVNALVLSAVAHRHQPEAEQQSDERCRAGHLQVLKAKLAEACARRRRRRRVTRRSGAPRAGVGCGRARRSAALAPELQPRLPGNGWLGYAWPCTAGAPAALLLAVSTFSCSFVSGRSFRSLDLACDQSSPVPW